MPSFHTKPHKDTMLYSFSKYEEFKTAVDLALENPISQCVLSPIPYTEAFRLIQLSLNENLPEIHSINVVNTIYMVELGMIAAEATFAHHLLDIPLEPYFSVAHTLRDALRQTGDIPAVSAQDPRWIEAIRVALAFSGQDTTPQSVSYSPQHRHTTFAQSIKFFRSRGLKLRLKGEKIDIVTSSLELRAVAETAIQPLISLGDIQAMKLIQDVLLVKYDPLLRRVRLHPNPDAMGRKMDRALPCGHLYRLALKTLGRKRSVVHQQPMRLAAATAAINLAALYDVEPFSIYEGAMYADPKHILETLGNITTYDELFTIPQCRPQVMGALLGDLFATPIAPLTDALGWRHSDVMHLWDLLLTLSLDDVKSVFVKRNTFVHLLAQRVGKNVADSLLDSFVIRKPNSEFYLPSDANCSDTRECAIGHASDDHLWIPGQLFLGPPFYSRLFSQCVALSDEFSNQVGVAFELRMVRKLEHLGIACRRGNLGPKKALAGDADLIVETEDLIALFELKKKGLRRETNAGNNLHLAVDLAQGLVHGVTQLAKQELSLLKDGILTFTDGSTLTHDGRRIIKIVLSLGDFGGLHDALTVRHSLRALCGVTLNPVRSLTKDQSDGLNKANKIFQTLAQRQTEYQKLAPDGSADQLFENVLFHNIFSVEQVLESKRTAKEFLSSLLLTSRIVTGSRDAVSDFGYFDNISKQ